MITVRNLYSVSFITVQNEEISVNRNVTERLSGSTSKSPCWFCVSLCSVPHSSTKGSGRFPEEPRRAARTERVPAGSSAMCGAHLHSCCAICWVPLRSAMCMHGLSSSGKSDSAAKENPGQLLFVCREHLRNCLSGTLEERTDYSQTELMFVGQAWLYLMASDFHTD